MVDHWKVADDESTVDRIHQVSAGMCSARRPQAYDGVIVAVVRLLVMLAFVSPDPG
ncbi:hypothetical protein HEP86_02080 [Streptomyces sp. RPA4-5]|uniref:hypothetical protein n=1 Tax=Streptomyces sp. RPA4-5 TaxID=2721245 RepID=UPI00143E6DFB|nr:hypothetical protein [Streptomyces sp. RPA4-5]QIY53502.1 hypothetical protein HEP86_02080 [Streptomyces sp. RPA4-5]